MKFKKILKMLKEVKENHSSKYTQEELDYMDQQLQIIESELQRITHKDYKGFGKK